MAKNESVSDLLKKAVRSQRILGRYILRIIMSAIQKNDSSNLSLDTRCRCLCAESFDVAGEFGIAVGIYDKEKNFFATPSIIGEHVLSVIINGLSKTIYISGSGFGEKEFPINQKSLACEEIFNFLRTQPV